MRKRKFYRRLFLTYLGIVFIYTAFMITLFFMGAKKYISSRLDIQNQLFIDQYAKTVENSLEMALNTSKQIFSSGEVRTFLLSNQIDYYNLTLIYQRIQKTLSPFSNLNFFMAIGKNQEDMLITTNGTLTKEAFYDKMQFPFQDEQEGRQYFADWGKGIWTLKSETNFYHYSEPVSLLTFIDIQRLTNHTEMISYISYPEKDLFPDIANLSKGALLVKNDQGTMVSRNYGMDQDHWEQVISSDFNQVALDDYTHYTYDLGLSSLKVNYIVEKPSFYDMWVETMSEFGWLYVGLILFGGISAFFITKKVYHPLLQVVTQFQEKYNISGMSDEFAIIQTASEKMKATKEELEQIICANKVPLKAKFMRDLLFGLSDQDDIEEKKVKFDLQDFMGPFCLLVIEQINYTKMEENFSEAKLIEIRKNMVEVYKELLIKKVSRYEIMELETNRIAILLSQAEYSQIQADFENLLALFETDYGIKVLAVLGKSVNRLEDINYSYSSAIDQLSYRNLLPNNKVVMYNKKLEVKPMAYYYPLDIEESLINYVEQRKEEETHLLLDHILNQNYKHHNMTGETVSLLTFAIIATINRVLNQQFKSVEDVYGQGLILYLELKSTKGEEDFKGKVHSLFQTLLEKLEDRQDDSQENSLANRLLDYIHLNYHTDISLNDVAEVFAITPTYVSMLFKKEYKTNFKDYLNRYKIEQAKEIIKKNKNIKNKDLSEAVGFNSVNTFSRLFKKYTGETPGKYIESKR